MLRRTVIQSALATIAVGGARFAQGAERPAFKLFDTHAHFYTSDVDRYPIRADVAPAALAKAKSRPTTEDVILKLWDASGVELGCGVQYNTTYATDNRYLLDVAARHPDRIRPVVILDPVDPATPAALARMVRDNHIRGVRFAGGADASGSFVFLSDAAGATWRKANDLGLVIVLMPTGSGGPQAMKRIAELADRYPRVNIVVDHIGFPTAEVSPTFGLSPEHRALAAHKTVYYKYTTLLIDRLQKGGVPTKDFLNHVVAVYGADHLVWGSDLGNTDGDYADFVSRALDSAADLKPQEKKAIFSDTARRLFA